MSEMPNLLPPEDHIVHVATEARIGGRGYSSEEPLAKAELPSSNAVRDNVVNIAHYSYLRGESTPFTQVMDDRMIDITREEINAKIHQSAAEAETKIVRVEGKIETLGTLLTGKIDALAKDVRESKSYNRDSRLIIVSTIIGAVIALGALMIAMATYGDALFGRGMNVRDVVQSTIKETMEQLKR